MKEYKINVTTQFKEELKNSLYFFPHSYNTRRKLHHEIRNIVASLSIFPERFNKFVITYEVDNEKNEVYILHIFSQKQDYLNQL